MFPSGYHVFCWNHLKRDLQFYLRNKANCTATDINYFVNAFQGLITECTETEFDQAWTSLKSEKKFHSNHIVLNYFESNLIPAFKIHSSIWVLKSAGVLNSHKGVTNNPSESMNAVLHSLQNWKQVPLDVICTSLYHLCTYYHREIERGIHNCGSWELCEEFSSLSMHLTCSSPHCPGNNQIIDRFPSTYSFSNSAESFQEQINQQFPQIGSEYGYCGAEFHSDPPPNALYALNDRINADDDNDDDRRAFYECRGIPKV